MKKILAIIAAALIFGTCGCQGAPTASAPAPSAVSSESPYISALDENDYCMHALGGIDGYDYLNTIDALSLKYSLGFRLFEGDASLTSDGRLVMLKSFDAEYFEKLGLPYDESAASYDDFMSLKIQGKYRATSFADVLDFMRSHDDMYLMLDSGLRDYDSAVQFYTAVLAEAGSDKAVLDRVLLSALNADVLRGGLSVYPFALRNFYIPAEKHRADGLKTIDDIIAYCRETGCQSCSINAGNVTGEICRKLKENGIALYVFTVNDEAKAEKLLKAGATVIGTDFLGRPADTAFGT